MADGSKPDHSQYCARHMWNIITQGPCCQCMTSEAKLAYVWEQVRLAKMAENPPALMCPYCLSVAEDGSKPCCKTLGNAIAAILQREDVMQCVMEQANRN